MEVRRAPGGHDTPPASLDVVCRTPRTRYHPQDIQRVPNGFLHVVILVDGLPRLGREAVCRAIEEGLESLPTQRHGSPRFNGECHLPRRGRETGLVSTVEFLTAVCRRRALMGSLDTLPRGGARARLFDGGSSEGPSRSGGGCDTPSRGRGTRPSPILHSGGGGFWGGPSTPRGSVEQSIKL